MPCISSDNGSSPRHWTVGDARMDAVLDSVDGSVRFFGLTPTNMQLEGLERHQRLLDSYKKLHTARARSAGTSSQG